MKKISPDPTFFFHYSDLFVAVPVRKKVIKSSVISRTWKGGFPLFFTKASSVFQRCVSRIVLKHLRKVREIAVPHIQRHRIDRQRALCQKLFCLLHPLLDDIITDRNTLFFFKNPGQIIRIQKDKLPKLLPVNLLPVMCIDISAYLTRNRI